MAKSAHARAVRSALVVALTAGLAGCSDSLPSLPKLGDLNPFAEKQQPLPGKRIPVMTEQTGIGADMSSSERPLTLSPPIANDSWSQPGGTANNSPGHLALGGSLKQAWSTDAGTGSTGYGKLTASPIVAGGKIFVLDTTGKVTAISASGGGIAWRATTTPDGEKDREGYGGGLAADNGRVYAATGFGVVVALDAGSGKKLWERVIGVPMRASPTAAGDRVYVTTIEGTALALNGADGKDVWQVRGVAERASLVGNASPAVDQDAVVFPFSSGDILAIKVSNGMSMWSESLARTRSASSLAALSDAARPVVDGGTVFAVGHAGRMVATSLKTGERLWSVSVPGTQAPAVAGDGVFVVDTTGVLYGFTRREGKVAWQAKLPGNGTWAGPVAAGGKLWLGSSSGQIVSVDPATGKPASTIDLGQPVYIAPIVAGGRMYVLTDKARLVALN
jgi:outer membrane protein assembly factor BamB